MPGALGLFASSCVLLLLLMCTGASPSVTQDWLGSCREAIAHPGKVTSLVGETVHCPLSILNSIAPLICCCLYHAESYIS